MIFILFNYFLIISISELVQNEQNGLLFDKSSELVQCLMRLLKNFPSNIELVSMKERIVKNYKKDNWQDNWTKNALPFFRN